MVRTLRLSRLAIRLIATAAVAALAGTACGGSDLLRDDFGGADAAPLDAAASDGANLDGKAADGAPTDGSNGADATDGMVLPHTDPFLGGVVDFAVFAGSTVTNVNATTITGDLGTYPSPTPIGPTPPTLIGAYHLGDTVANTAHTDLITAYNDLTPASTPGCVDLSGQDLGGLTLPPGVYCFSTSAQLTGTLTLDATLDGGVNPLDAGASPSPRWLFQIGSTLTTGALGPTPAAVTVIGGNPCNVYWQVGSSATLGTGTSFSGNILAAAAVTLVTGTTVAGRVLAINASVTMDTNTVTIAGCP